MDLSAFRIVVLISICSVLIPLVVYVARVKSLATQSHIIGLLLVTSAIFDTINFVHFTNNQSNYWSSNLYSIIQFGLLARFFYEILFRMYWRKFFYSGAVCFCLVLILATFSFQDIRSEYQSIVWVTGALILCIYAYLYHTFVSAGSTHVIFNPHLHSELSIVGGIFVYFSFSIAFFIFVNYIMTNLDPAASRMIWSVHNANNVIKNIFFAFGIYLTGKRKIIVTKEEYDLIMLRERRSEANTFPN